MERTLSPDVFDLLARKRLPDPVLATAGQIRPGDPILTDSEQAHEMLAPLLWMMDRVGVDGLPLTKAGWLRPVDVTALMSELGWDQWWIGKNNREDLTAPASWLRESAILLKLIRKSKGQLLLTPSGRKHVDDPVALWFHVAQLLPLEKKPGQRAAATLCLLSDLGTTTDAVVEDESRAHARTAPSKAVDATTPRFNVAELMMELGWFRGDGEPLDSRDIFTLWNKTHRALSTLGIAPPVTTSVSNHTRREFLRAALTRPIPVDASELTQTGSRSTSQNRSMKPRTEPAHTLKVTLEVVTPPVWRRIVVPSDTTLLELHGMIQAALGWTDSHLFSFNIGTAIYGYPDPDWEEMGNAATIKLAEAVPVQGDRLEYAYDFGDGWSHTVEVEGIGTEADAPTVLAGGNACPPEDCGGSHGYQEFLAALADPKHPDHSLMTEWIGFPFDPREFDLAQANAAIKRQVQF